MALIFLDSFDHYVTAQMTRKWTENELGASFCYILPTSGRRDGGCVRVAATTFNNYLNKTITPAPTSTTVIVGCAFRPVTFPNFCNPIVMIGETQGPHVGWAFNSDGTLRILAGRIGWDAVTALMPSTTLGNITSVVLHQNVWYFVELKATVHATLGTWELRVNEKSVGSGTAAVTRNVTYPGTGQWNIVGLHQYAYATAAGGSYDIDDFYLLDGSGTSGNDFWGDVEITAHHPTGAGASAQFTPTSGSNYEMVDDETPDDDTTVNTSTVAGNEDLFAMATMANPIGTICGLQLVGGFKKATAGTAQLQQALRVSGTTYYSSSTKSPSASAYNNEMDCYSVSPDTGTAFSAEEFNTIQAGYKRTA